jgi:hypothetical protein
MRLRRRFDPARLGPCGAGAGAASVRRTLTVKATILLVTLVPAAIRTQTAPPT